MKIILLISLLILTSCSSTKERKPFMIVGKKQSPTYFGSGIGLDFDLGSSKMKGNALNTRYKEFSTFGIIASTGVGIWSNNTGLSIGYSYRYNYYYKDITDPNDSNKTVTAESFRGINQRFAIGVARELFRDRYAAYGISASYHPYTKTKFTKVSTLPEKRFSANGTAYSAGLYLASYLLSCDMNYKRINYKQDLSEDIFTAGCGYAFSIFK